MTKRMTRLEANYSAARAAVASIPAARIVGHTTNSVVWVWYPTSDKSFVEMTNDLVSLNKKAKCR